MQNTIAFIGLGTMGLPMATNLVSAGYSVIGYNRSSRKRAHLAKQGGQAADSVAEATRDADIIITMLPDSPDVKSVMTGKGGVLNNCREGAYWIDSSTIRPDVTIDIADQARAAGLKPFDAPVSGGEQGAVDGTLSIMVGGAESDFTTIKPVLDVLGSTVVHVGSLGAGQTVKAANQLIVAGNIALLAEALTFIESQQVNSDAAIDVLAGGLAGSKVLEQKAKKMVQRSFDPGFRLELHHKDMGIVTEAARSAGVVTPVTSLVAELVAASIQQAQGTLDHSALFNVINQLSNLPSNK